MRKRILAIMLAAITVFSMSGCSVKDMIHVSTDVDINVHVDSADKNDNKKDDKKDNDKDVLKLPDKDTDLPVSDLMLLRYSYGDDVTFVYLDGTVEGTYALPEESSFIGYDGFTVFYSSSEKDGDKYYTGIFSRNLKTGTDKMLGLIEYPSNLDYYDGKITYTSYNDSGRRIEYTLDVATGLISENTEFNEDTEGYTMVYDYKYLCTSRRYLDSAGYVILNKDGVLYKYDRDAIVKLDLPKDVSGTPYWDKDHIFCTTTGEIDTEWGLYVYNINDGSFDLLSTKYTRILDDDNGRVYFLDTDDSDYGKEVYNIRYYDRNTRKVGEYVSLSRQPGINNYYGVVDSFRCRAGVSFYANCTDAGVEWYRATENAQGTFRAEAIGVSEGIASWYPYGHVEAYSDTDKCPNCGQTINQYYEEYFVLDDEQSAYAADINAVLKAIADDNRAHYGSDGAGDDEVGEDCDLHGTYAGKYTYDHTVYNVRRIKDHYITVDMDGYIFMGGAHGLPFTGHYLFDLDTGKEVTIADLYNGTEKQFKEFVATKVKEDLLSYDDPSYAPYYTSDPDDLYTSTYEMVDFNTCPIMWNEDSMTFDFQPYALGPFAAGFISIEVSYDDADLNWD